MGSGCRGAAVAVIVNADDLGHSAARDQATFELMGEGLVTSATVLANGPSVKEACERAKSFPRCSFGVHLNLTEFRPLSRALAVAAFVGSDGQFHGRARKIGGLWRYRQLIFEELCVQLELLQSRGISVSHLDSHHHVHTIPAILPVIRALLRRYGLHRVRISRNVYSLDQRPGVLLLVKKRLFNAALRHWCRARTTDAFTDLPAFIEARGRMPKSYRTVEIMLHPGAPESAEEPGSLRVLAANDAEFRRSLVSYQDL